MLKKILQGDYTACANYYQFKLPLELDAVIPDDDSVRLLSAFVEGMDLSSLYDTYGKIRKNQASPCQLLKIVLYANMNRIYSSRDIEKACLRDINFMYLLEGMPPPDHSTISRFHSLHLSQCSEEVLKEQVGILLDLGEISAETVFIDGTKIEAYANRYTFVWKKAVTKNMRKRFDRITSFVAECEEMYGLKIVYNQEISIRTLKRLRKKLYAIKKEENITFVHGTGKRKTPLQRSIEQLEEHLDKLKEYTHKLHICGERNSYSKTDPDATFMRMKEDHMLNGQLKPAYNVQHAVDSEYVTWVNVSAHPTDTLTLIPLLKDMERVLGFKYQEVVADAGYEGEENYVFLDQNGQKSYIKPNNYEISKRRKYKNDIGRKENMLYDAVRDCYICHNGKEITSQKLIKEKTRSGYIRNTTIYRCDSCKGCPYKGRCIKGNNCQTPMEERSKTIYVSKTMEHYRKENLERFTSDRGTQLRVNRSIQAEGSFGNIKEDMGFRQYKFRGKQNVLMQSILIAMAQNMNKLHAKIQSGRTGTHLFELKNTA